MNKWFKYRHKYREGGGEYNYLQATDLIWAKEYVNEEVGHDFSDEVYRGLDIEEIDCPPQDFLEKEIKRKEERLESQAAQIIELKNLLVDKYGVEFWRNKK